MRRSSRITQKPTNRLAHREGEEYGPMKGRSTVRPQKKYGLEHCGAHGPYFFLSRRVLIRPPRRSLPLPARPAVAYRSNGRPRTCAADEMEATMVSLRHPAQRAVIA